MVKIIIDGVEQRLRVATLVVNVTHVLPGTFEAWPAKIQDGIYAALERLSMRKRADFKIMRSYSDRDVDTGPYIYVEASALENIQ